MLIYLYLKNSKLKFNRIITSPTEDVCKFSVNILHADKLILHDIESLMITTQTLDEESYT